MTTDNANILNDDRAKKRAYGMRARAEELGYRLSMGHTYDLLASAHGYRDWATMKPIVAAATECDSDKGGKLSSSTKRHERSLTLGQTMPNGRNDQMLDGETLRFPFSKLPEHIEVLSTTDRARTDFLVRLTQATIIEDVGSAMFFHGHREHLGFLKRAAERAEADLLMIDLNGEFRRRGEQLDLYRQLDVAELALYLFGLVTFESSRPNDDIAWRKRFSVFTMALARALVWLRDEKSISLDHGTISDCLTLDNVIDVCTSVRYPDIPEDVIEPLRSYCESLPLFRWENRRNQALTTVDQHWYFESKLTTALSDSRDFLDNACWPPGADFEQAIDDGHKIVVALPEPTKMNAAKWATVQTILAVIHRLAQKRAERQFPFIIALDLADRYTLIDFQTLMRSAAEANCGFVLASDRPLPLPRLKASPSIRIGGTVGNRYSAQLVTTSDVKDFQFADVQATG